MEKRFCYILCSSFSDITLKIKARSNQASKAKMIQNNRRDEARLGLLTQLSVPDVTALSQPEKKYPSGTWWVVRGFMHHLIGSLPTTPQGSRRESALPISQLAKRTTPYDGLGPKRRAAPLLLSFIQFILHVLPRVARVHHSGALLPGIKLLFSGGVKKSQ